MAYFLIPIAAALQGHPGHDPSSIAQSQPLGFMLLPQTQWRPEVTHPSRGLKRRTSRLVQFGQWPQSFFASWGLIFSHREYSPHGWLLSYMLPSYAPVVALQHQDERLGLG